MESHWADLLAHLEHFTEHPTEHLWNTMVSINSVLCALAIIFCIYSAGASIYYLTPRPIEFAALLVFILLCTEVAFGVLEEQFD